MLSGGGLYYGIMAWKTAQFARIAARSLNQDEAVIDQRLAEIQRRQAYIQHVLQSFENSDAQTSPLLTATLQQALTTLQTQYRQYQLKRWEVALIRWSNRLRPLIEIWEQATYDQCQVYHQEFTQIARRGNELLQQWQQFMHGIVATTSGHIPLQQALTTIQKIQQALQARQVALTVQGISQSDDGWIAGLSPEHAFDDLTIFNTLADLHEFSTSFQTLEDTYRRLKIEAEVGV